MATLMQMWNMVIVGGNTQAGRGDGGGAPATAINQTHGLPAGDWQPGMRGHIQAGQMGIENGVGPSYGPGTPYTVTNTQSIIEAVVKGTSRSEYGANADPMPGRSLNTMAPPGTAAQTTSSPVDQTSNGSPPVITVGSGQAQTTVRPMPMPGSNESSGGQSAASVVAGMMTNPNPPAKTAYEDYTQMALQSEPPAVNSQADRANNRNSNKANGRTAVAGGNQGWNPYSQSSSPGGFRRIA